MQTETPSEIRKDVFLSLEEQKEILRRFRETHPEFFQKNDRVLLLHLFWALSFLAAFTFLAIRVPNLILKTFFSGCAAVFWFSLINVTIHHHHTHHNAAQSRWANRLLDALYQLIPQAQKRKSRYIRAHLNHHARPFHSTDVDHLFGRQRYQNFSRSLPSKFLYFLELSVVGEGVPAWEEDRYMNGVEIENWNLSDYEAVMKKEARMARFHALIYWSIFFAAMKIFPPLAWGWILPMQLVKNWAHYLGQFQHYDDKFLDPERGVWTRTKTYFFPGWLNYLLGGEISGHFIHHLFPQMPYYYVEQARQRMVDDPKTYGRFIFY